MRYDYVRPFVTSAQHVLQQVLSGDVAAGRVRLSRAPSEGIGVTTIIGVSGEGDGQVSFEKQGPKNRTYVNVVRVQ